MSKWGLLRGAGQGIAQAGNMLMVDRLDQMKEERLQKYQQVVQQKQFDREDTIRAQDTAQRNTERAEDRTEREQADVRQITLRANERVQDQANVDRQFEVNNNLVNRQIEQINQEIDINGMEIDRQRDIKSVWDKIQDTEDPAELENLFDRYRRLTGTDKDDKYSLHSNPEFDPTTGERIGTSMYTHNSRTNEITPYAGGAAQSRPSLAELLGSATENAAQPQGANPAPTTQGLLRPQPEVARSPEAQSVLARREAEQQSAQQLQQQQASERSAKNTNDTLSSIELNVVGNGRATGIPTPSKEQLGRYEDRLLQVIESESSTSEQKSRARTLLRQIEAKL